MDKLKILLLSSILSSIILTAQQWEPGSPINPLDVRDFAVNQDGNIFCAVAGSVTGNFIKGAIFISTDQETWRPFWDNPDQYVLTSLAINNSGDIFAASDSGGVYRTTDGGNTWESINNGLTSLRISELNAEKPGYMFACSKDSGVFRSTNNGDTWTQVNNGLTSTYIEAFMVGGNGDVFCGANLDPELFGSGIFRSSDNGDTWVHPVDGVVARDFTINQVNNNYFAVVSSAVYSSTDDGVTWDYVSSGNFRAIAADDLGNLFAGGGSSGGYVYKSTDNGLTWTELNTGFISDVNSIFIVPDQAKNTAGDHDDLIGTTEGIIRTNDQGESFSISDRGLSQDIIKALNKVHVTTPEDAEIILAGTADHGVYRQVAYDENWVPLLVPPGTELKSVSCIITDVVDETTRFIIDALNNIGDNVIMAYDNPNSMGEIRGDGTPNEHNTHGAMNPDNGDIYLTFNPGGLYYTNTFGVDFSKLGGVTPLENANGFWIDVEWGEIFVYTEPDNIWLGPLPGYDFSHETVDTSLNFIIRVEDYLFAGTVDGFREKPGIDEDWINLPKFNAGLGTDLNIKGSYTINQSLDNFFIYFWNDPDLYKYDEEEEQWNPFKEGMGDFKFAPFCLSHINYFTPRNNAKAKENETATLLMGTDHGLYYRDVDITTGIETNETSKSSMPALKQNFPNPFRQTTRIGYTIPQKSKVRITILDSFGEKVTELVDQEQNAGTYDIDFNATGFPAGIYFYELYSGIHHEMKKMVLIN